MPSRRPGLDANARLAPARSVSSTLQPRPSPRRSSPASAPRAPRRRSRRARPPRAHPPRRSVSGWQNRHCNPPLWKIGGGVKFFRSELPTFGAAESIGCRLPRCFYINAPAPRPVLLKLCRKFLIHEILNLETRTPQMLRTSSPRSSRTRISRRPHLRPRCATRSLASTLSGIQFVEEDYKKTAVGDARHLTLATTNFTAGGLLFSNRSALARRAASSRRSRPVRPQAYPRQPTPKTNAEARLHRILRRLRR